MYSAKELEHYQRVRAQFEQPDDKSAPPPDPEALDPGTSYHFEQTHPQPPQLKIDRKGKGRAVPINQSIGSKGGSRSGGSGSVVVNGVEKEQGEGEELKFGGQEKGGEDEADLYGE